jgi:hypothetical protein
VTGRDLEGIPNVRMPSDNWYHRTPVKVRLAMGLCIIAAAVVIVVTTARRIPIPLACISLAVLFTPMAILWRRIPGGAVGTLVVILPAVFAMGIAQYFYPEAIRHGWTVALQRVAILYLPFFMLFVALELIAPRPKPSTQNQSDGATRQP